MTATLTAAESAASVPAPVRPVEGSVLSHALRSEWTKLRSVRSTMWSLLATIAITVGFGLLLSWAFTHRFNHLDVGERINFDPTLRSLMGSFLAQLAMGTLGVLVISSEYTTGMIRTTFAAVPQRRTVLTAKAIVLFAVALVAGLVASFSAFFVGQAVFASRHIGVSLGDPHVLRAVLGCGLYLALVAVFGFGLGAILRRTAGAISTLFGFVLVLPILAQALPSPWNTNVSKILPGEAGRAMFAVKPQPDLMTAGAGLAVFLVWVVGTLVIANVLVTRRDA
jgi:ABC-2 type transport system permease protein